ncbi:MAG: DUF4430 domain-containing protein [Candidatus Pacebacteria bacterium]|nr:DUF4430 domain-containing protein [Candidatus Paceibacterota bacterium]
MTTKKIISITFLVVISIGILVSGIYFLSLQSSQLAGKKIAQQIVSSNLLAKDIDYKINNGQEVKDYKVDFVASSTVFSALQSLGQKEKFTVTYKIYPEMGVLVQGINGLVNGTEDKYWQYWVNDVLGDVACDKKFLKAGDKVQWKFEIAPVF